MTAKAKEPTKATESEEIKVVDTVDLYNANDGIHGRDGGPYLDQEEAKHWEAIHAAREGRTPDLTNPGAYPGILLRSASEQVNNYNPTLLAGDERRDHSKFQAKPVVTDSPVVESNLTDFSLTDTEDKGDFNEFETIDPPLKDNPSENNVSVALAEQEK